MTIKDSTGVASMRSSNLRSERIREKRRVICAALATVLATAIAWSGSAIAQTAAARKPIALVLTAGQSYVIDQLAPDATPAVRVIDNPHALVVHRDGSGNLVLLAAERGRWMLTVTRADHQQATYDVAVNGVATPGVPLDPGTSPEATTQPGLAGARAAASLSATPSIGSAAAPPVSSAPGQTVSIATPKDGGAKPDLAAARNFGFAPSPPPPPASAGESGDEAPIGQWRSNPAVAATGRYYSPSISGGPRAPSLLPAGSVVLMQDTSRVLDFHRRLTRVSIADSKIADIQVVNPYQINLVAHAPGFTTLAVWDDQGEYQERQVRVDTGGPQQVMLNCVVAELDRSNIENQGINLSLALTNYGLSLVGLPGSVATPFSPQSNVTTTLPNGTTTSGSAATMAPAGALMPLLLSQSLTYGLAAGNSSIQTQSFFQFLESHNLARILAEPHLLANSGEQAKFLSGGEIPIVIAQALNTSIVFKQFGTSIEFLPTVIGRDTIELYVKPEVSQPDYAHGVSMFGFTVPAFVTRRAQTMVRLHDGQTLILAGLILHNPVSIVNKVPYLGDVPYLGGLFRTTSHTTTETDLVISVNPQIVRPLPDGAQVELPRDARLSSAEIKTRALEPPDASRPRF